MRLLRVIIIKLFWENSIRKEDFKMKQYLSKPLKARSENSEKVRAYYSEACVYSACWTCTDKCNGCGGCGGMCSSVCMAMCDGSCVWVYAV
jgi:hypothetical protein